MIITIEADDPQDKWKADALAYLYNNCSEEIKQQAAALIAIDESIENSFYYPIDDKTFEFMNRTRAQIYDYHN